MNNIKKSSIWHNIFLAYTTLENAKKYIISDDLDKTKICIEYTEMNIRHIEEKLNVLE